MLSWVEPCMMQGIKREGQRQNMNIQIDNRQKLKKIIKKKLREQAEVILKAMNCPNAELSLVLLDDNAIGELNATWLQRSGPTNVIAFPMQSGVGAEITPHLLGDVVISVETAAREAREAGMSLARRLTELLIHGILHLLGYDHETTPAEARTMQEQANRLMALFET